MKTEQMKISRFPSKIDVIMSESIGCPKKQTHADLTPFKKVTISIFYLLIRLHRSVACCLCSRDGAFEYISRPRTSSSLSHHNNSISF